MNQRAVLAGALCLFAIGLGVYVLTLRTERDTARTEAQEARQDAATWKAAAQSGEAAVRELAAAKATAEAAAAERDATIKALTRDRDEQRRKQIHVVAYRLSYRIEMLRIMEFYKTITGRLCQTVMHTNSRGGKHRK